MTRFAPRSGPRDDAVATVVGAILVVSIIVVGLITFRSSFVPVWEEEAEQQFMDQVAESLLQVRSDLDRHVTGPGEGRLTTPVPTTQGEATPFAPPREGNLFSFESSSHTTTVHVDDATVWRRNRTLQVRENLNFRDIPGTDLTVQGVDEVLDLRIRFATLNADQAGDTVVVRIIGASGGLQGLIRYSVEDTRSGGAGGPERSELVAEVENAAGTTVFDQTIATFTQSQSNYEVDALDPWLGFDQILASAPAPKQLIFVENGLDGDRALTFRARNTTSDRTVVQPAGGPVETVHETIRGGSLRYESRNNFFVDQTYRIEAGALALEQPEGTALRAGPHAPAGRVESAAGQTFAGVGLGLPALEGDTETFAGAGVISAASEAVHNQGFRAVASDASFNFTTATPDAWASWARDHYQQSGIPNGEFTVTSGSDFVNVTVEGPSTDPAVDDVHVSLDRSRIDTTLER